MISILELGPQDLREEKESYLSTLSSLGIANDFKFDSDKELLYQAENLYKALGINEYRSLDYFNTRADYPIDLDHPVNLGKTFAIVTNFGTIEHLFNPSIACESIHNLLDNLGIAMHLFPCMGDIMHGIMNINPLFVDRMCEYNGYKIISWLYIDNAGLRELERNKIPYKCTDFSDLPIDVMNVSDFMKYGANEASIRQEFTRSVEQRFLENMSINLFNKSKNIITRDYMFVCYQKSEHKSYLTPSQYRKDAKAFNLVYAT